MEGIGVSGVPSNEVLCIIDESAGGEYGGGAVLMTVPGKYLGTKGAGPCIGGPSSDASVWNDSLREAVSLCDSRYARSRRLASVLRRYRESASDNARNPKSPTDPPTAPANVATLCELEPDDEVDEDLSWRGTTTIGVDGTLRGGE